jgi:hypothetical protein
VGFGGPLLPDKQAHFSEAPLKSPYSAPKLHKIGINIISDRTGAEYGFDIWLATFHIIEMLYDTPFPDTLQTDHTSEKAERNAEIIARYEAGETGASIAQAFGVSEQRVNQIIRGRQS